MNNVTKNTDFDKWMEVLNSQFSQKVVFASQFEKQYLALNLETAFSEFVR